MTIVWFKSVTCVFLSFSILHRDLAEFLAAIGKEVCRAATAEQVLSTDHKPNAKISIPKCALRERKHPRFNRETANSSLTHTRVIASCFCIVSTLLIATLPYGLFTMRRVRARSFQRVSFSSFVSSCFFYTFRYRRACALVWKTIHKRVGGWLDGWGSFFIVIWRRVIIILRRAPPLLLKFRTWCSSTIIHARVCLFVFLSSSSSSFWLSSHKLR